MLKGELSIVLAHQIWSSLSSGQNICCSGMSHPEFLERLFDGKKGEERDKKDSLKYTLSLLISFRVLF